MSTKSMFSFVSAEEKKAVEQLIKETPNAVEHLASMCHTLILTLKGQSYFIIQQVDESYGVLKILDSRMRAEILSVGGGMCGHGHKELVVDFLLDCADEFIRSDSTDEKKEFAIMVYSLLKLLAIDEIAQYLNLLNTLQSQPEIDIPNDVDYTQN